MGLEEFRQLKELEFNYCSKLKKLGCNAKSTNSLKSLTFYYYKAIKNHDYVTNLDGLATLAFNDCGSISSIKFVKKIKCIDDFIFSNTDVADGYISPCFEFRNVYFSNKKHSSYKVEETRSTR